MDKYILKFPKRNSDKRKNTTETADTNASCSKLNGVQNNIENQIDNSTNVKKKKYSQTYKCEWEIQFQWLQSVKGIAFCKMCFKTLENNFSHLKRHEATKLHRQKLKSQSNKYTLEECFDSAISKTNSISKFKSEVTCVMFCVQNNLSLSKMDVIPKFLKTVCKDSTTAQNIKCSRKKATSMIKNIIGPYMKENFSKQLQLKKFSLIIDETTDTSTKKCLVVVTRYFDEFNGRIEDKFFGLLKLQKCDAPGIFSAVKNQIIENKIPLENLIGLASDNAAVMAGNINGVKRLFLNENRDLFFLGCTCHSLHLCASAACKILPSHIEKIIKDIYNHFSHSSKRIDAFNEFQDYFNLANNKILRLSSTRWLSMEQVVNRILQQWDALKHYFHLNSFEDPSNINTKEISAFLMDSANKLYLIFLSYTLNLIVDKNKVFQSETTKIHFLDTYMKELYTGILKNFVKLQYVNTEANPNDSSVHLPFSEMFFGLYFEEYSVSKQELIDDARLLNIKKHLLEFYIELCKQIRLRFNFNDNKIQLLKFLEIKEIVKGDLSTLQPLFQAFPFIKGEKEKLNNQWRSLIGNHEIIEKYYDPDVVKFWSNLKSKTNLLGEFVYKELSTVMLELCSLPHSSASAERKFSSLNLIKNNIRSNLETSTVENIMLCKELANKDRECWDPDSSPDSQKLFEYFRLFKFSDGEYKKIH